jgi:3-oxoacyl-[acyl-carrier protein] reductase
MTNRVVDLWEGYTEEKRKNILKQIPLNRPSSVDEQVNVIKFLCSEESSYITGTVIDVNGGMFVG